MALVRNGTTKTLSLQATESGQPHSSKREDVRVYAFSVSVSDHITLVLKDTRALGNSTPCSQLRPSLRDLHICHFHVGLLRFTLSEEEFENSNWYKVCFLAFFKAWDIRRIVIACLGHSTDFQLSFNSSILIVTPAEETSHNYISDQLLIYEQRSQSPGKCVEEL